MLKKLKPYLSEIKALSAGAILVLSFAPFYFASLAIVSMALLLWVLHEQSPKQAFKLGYCFGLGCFGFGATWVYHSIHVFGMAPMPLAALITGLFVLILALFPALKCWLLVKWFPHDNIDRIVLAFPSIWVLGEILRGYFLTGFPWLYVGNSQTENILRGFAPVGSVWLVSFVVALAGGLLYRLYLVFHQHEENKIKRNLLILGFVLIWPVAYVLKDIQWSRQSASEIPVSLIQGNVPQMLRWDPRAVNHILTTYAELTAPQWGERLIVWPESAIPVPIPQANTVLSQLQLMSENNHSALIVGIPQQNAPQENYFNTVVALGSATGSYRKTHLVPFGEYVPLETALRGLIGFFDLPMSDFVPFKQEQAPIMAFGIPIGSAICYEIAYPTLVRDRALNSQMLLTVSNDAWFGRTIGPPQHLQIAQMRAIETGRSIIRATNNGLTAIIAPNGQFEYSIDPFEANVLEGYITPYQGLTPWVRFGLWPWLAIYIALIALGWWRDLCLAQK